MEELKPISMNPFSEEEVLTALRENPRLVLDMEERTEEHILVAVQQAGYLLQHIPKPSQTYEICLAAVTQDGFAIKHVSKKLRCKALYIAAVCSEAQALCYIPADELDDELINALVDVNGRVIQYLESKRITEALCRKAILQNASAIQHVPNKYLTKELITWAVSQDGLTLEHVAGNKKSKILCEIAIQNNPLALEFVPNRFKTEALCEEAVREDWCAFEFVPESMITLSNCLKFLRYLVSLLGEMEEGTLGYRHKLQRIAASWPEDINENPQIIALERKLGARCFIQKRYNSERAVFVTEEHVLCQSETSIVEHESFAAFYAFLDGDIAGADLYEYNFKGINLSDYNIDGAIIKSSILVEQGRYDAEDYIRLVSRTSDYTKMTLAAGCELAPAVSEEQHLEVCSMLGDDSRKLYYVSDLHLDHKLLKAFPSYATRYEIENFVSQVVNQLVETATNRGFGDYLLIAGDISFNIEVSTIFYELLVKKWGRNIVVVLGNHELWDYDYNSPKLSPMDRYDLIRRYKELFDRLRIVFLHNALFILKDYQTIVIEEDEICSIDPAQLTRLCQHSRLVILGGLGYSGYNPEFNALSGIYRGAVTTMEEDVAETARFETLYSRLRSAADKLPVVVLTHMPKTNWSRKGYNSNWVYVSGHTHRNEFCCDEEKTVYADNQIGYHGRSVGLKFFCLSKLYDVFANYADGIYTISRDQYLAFNRGKLIEVTFNRDGGEIFMLKHSGVYCFIYEQNRRRYLLSGGQTRCLGGHDLEYYYNWLPKFALGIEYIFRRYRAALKDISDAIKKIGGTGKIHGSIVDIDFYNHISLDPKDGSVTPYFAWSMVDRWEYRDIRTLLRERREDLYSNYIRWLPEETAKLRCLEGDANTTGVDSAEEKAKESMYGKSRILRAVQYIVEANVVRIWDDKLLEQLVRLEKDKILLEP